MTQTDFNRQIKRLLGACKRDILMRIKVREEWDRIYVRKYTVQAHFRKRPKRQVKH